MNRTVFELQIQNLRNKRMGKAKPVKVVSEKSPSGAVKISSLASVPQKVNSVKPFKQTVTPPSTKSGGCGCSRK